MSESTPTLSFRIPRNNDTLQQLIWAFGVTRPDPDPSSTLEQHLDAGKLMLDLTKTIPSTTSSSPSETSTSSPTDTLIPDSPGNSQGPFRDPILAAHMVLSFIGFLVLLPSAALIARWGRTRTAAWFKLHWLLNVIFGIPVIVIGWVLGPLSVSRRGRAHIINEHQVIPLHERLVVSGCD